MRLVSSIALVCLALAPVARGETVEPISEYRFDAAQTPPPGWELKGDAAIREGALVTLSNEEADDHAQAKGGWDTVIPDPLDTYLLRLECALVPIRIGGWGQDIQVEGGPFVVEFTGKHPTLNARHGARDSVEQGKETLISCDFNRNAVFSWKIDGKEQLDAPVGAWHQGAETARVSLNDFKESASETRWLWVRLSKVTPDDTLPLVLSGWGDLPRVGKDEPSEFLIGQASPMTKVFREATDFKGSFSSSIRIAAAGRERESFQLVVMPLKNDLAGVEATVSDLIHADGTTRLSADHVSWHPVGYIQTRPSNSSIRRAGWWWPDVLMPAAPFDVEAGFVQPIWFTVDVPDGTKPGVYRGIVEIGAQGAPPRMVGLELTVRPFSLPLRGKLRTAFCISAGLWEMWYAPDEVKKRMNMSDSDRHGPLYTSNECADVLPHERWLEMYDFLLAHRLSPTTIYSGLRNGRSRVVPAREDMQYCYDRGMNATCLVNVDVLPQDPEAADKAMAELEAWLRDWEDFVKEKNWEDFTWYVHGFDESEMREDPETTVDPHIRRVSAMIGEKFPWVKRETANPLMEKHIGNFDIWTPVTPQITEENLPEYRKRQEAGDEAWAYVCCGPGKPYANLFIDFPGVDPRILGWQFHQKGLTGFLYYLINLYDSQENWNMNAPKWPDVPWDPYSFKTNSDGILIYPGPNMTPLASTRLENLRDGIEDYEALAMLDELCGRAAQAGEHEELVARAREVIAVRPEVSKSWTEYTQDPEVIAGARREVDGLIEELTKGLAGK